MAMANQLTSTCDSNTSEFEWLSDPTGSSSFSSFPAIHNAPPGHIVNTGADEEPPSPPVVPVPDPGPNPGSNPGPDPGPVHPEFADVENFTIELVRTVQHLQEKLQRMEQAQKPMVELLHEQHARIQALQRENARLKALELNMKAGNRKKNPAVKNQFPPPLPTSPDADRNLLFVTAREDRSYHGPKPIAGPEPVPEPKPEPVPEIGPGAKSKLTPQNPEPKPKNPAGLKLLVRQEKQQVSPSFEDMKASSTLKEVSRELREPSRDLRNLPQGPQHLCIIPSIIYQDTRIAEIIKMFYAFIMRYRIPIKLQEAHGMKASMTQTPLLPCIAGTGNLIKTVNEALHRAKFPDGLNPIVIIFHSIASHVLLNKRGGLTTLTPAQLTPSPRAVINLAYFQNNLYECDVNTMGRVTLQSLMEV